MPSLNSSSYEGKSRRSARSQSEGIGDPSSAGGEATLISAQLRTHSARPCSSPSFEILAV